MTFARDLRNNATPEERALWRMLGRLRPRFTRQLKIGPLVADFAGRKARLIVELDGCQHVDREADRRRDAMLETDGWRVLRFWNADLHAHPAGVIETIARAVEARLPENEYALFATSRAGRTRRPRTRIEEEPPPVSGRPCSQHGLNLPGAGSPETPPRHRGGENE